MTNIQKAALILEKEFGPQWKSIAQMLGTEDLRKRVGKELTSFTAFPERGFGGDNKWRGNCSPEVIRAVVNYALDCKNYYGKETKNFTLLDPMSGSGTSHIVAQDLGVNSILYDLNPTPSHGIGNWNALKDEVDDSADFIFFHPPYHGIVRYSGNMWGNPHPDDLSRCENYADFIEKLNFVIKKLYMALRKDGRLAILVGDIRMNGKFYSIQNDIMRMGELESFIVKSQFNCVSDSRTYKKPFVPIVTEYMLLLHKENVLILPFSKRVTNEANIMNCIDTSLTWNHLIRTIMESVGGRISLSELYDKLSEHPKAKRNSHYRERIRATIYEHKDLYLTEGNGNYYLNYEVA